MRCKQLFWAGILLPIWTTAPATCRAQARPVAAPGQISGTVSDAGTQQPLTGVTVLLQRTHRGVATDAQGRFRLVAHPTDTLLVRALGYKPQQVPLSRTSARREVWVPLQRDTVRLAEVRVTADRLDRASLNRALRNLRRPAPAAVNGPQRFHPQPLFPVDSTPPPPPPRGGTPIDFVYDKLSREGKERRKMQQIKKQEAQQQAQRRRTEYNKAFKDNRGYE